MCGIAGYFDVTGEPPKRSRLAGMLKSIAHRGPDGNGIWQGIVGQQATDGSSEAAKPARTATASVGFGHARLAILDTSDKAAQPMQTRGVGNQGAGLLSYNGEVYNYPDLRAELEAKGCRFESSGDTEVVLQALHHWGPQRAVPRFNGMFALAYLDARTGILWLARDRLGIKPLLVGHGDGRLWFASEAKALACCGDDLGPVDERALLLWVSEPHTIAEGCLATGIEAVPAGSIWQISVPADQAAADTQPEAKRAPLEIGKERYFHPLKVLDGARIMAGRAFKDSDLVRELETHLFRSTEMHLASDAPIATLCSGGVDSSLLTAFSLRIRPEIKSYVADFADTGEVERAQAVARHVGADLKVVGIDREDYLRRWPLAVHHADAPVFFASEMGLMRVADEVHRDGYKVLLSGEGADELFGGYSWYASTYRNWRQFDTFWMKLFPARRMRKIRRQELAPFSFAPQRVTAQRLGVAVGDATTLSPRRYLRALAQVTPMHERALAAHCAHDWTFHMPPLLHRKDRIPMAHSVEVRVPFLENAIMDFALNLPPGTRLRGGQTKWLLKQVALRHLPARIVTSKKKGFPASEPYWAGCERLLRDGHLAAHFGWSRDVGEDVLDQLSGDRHLAFALTSLEIWFRLRNGDAIATIGEELLRLASDQPAPAQLA